MAFSKLQIWASLARAKTLIPQDRSQVGGNDAAYRRSFDTGPVNIDLPVRATLRTRWIGTPESTDVVFGLDNVSLRFAAPGDANIDGLFNALDLVSVLQTGEYQDQIVGNSTWADGDWNGDHEFDSLDLVAALQTGHYGQATALAAVVPEPSGAVLVLSAVALLGCRRRLTARQMLQAEADA